MFFDQDDFLMQWDKEGLFFYLVDFGAGKQTHLEDVVDGEEMSFYR